MRSMVARFGKMGLLSFLIMMGLFAGLTSTTFAQSSAATFQAIPPVSVSGGLLDDVSTSSATDAWTVGVQYEDANTIIDTLAQHWNGQNWTVVSTPSPHNNVDVLSAVADISLTNAWAVGYGEGSNGFSQALIEHFNGTSWSVVTAPADTGNLDESLSAIAAVSASDVWAAGSHFDATLGGTTSLFEHWNGTAWSIVTAPSTVILNGIEHVVSSITSLAASSSNDVWASTGSGGVSDPTVFEHWDGTQWNLVQAPGVSNASVTISGLAAGSATNAWAVGTSRNSARHAPTLPLIEHWNGTAWSIVPGPTLSAFSDFLSGVTVLSATDAWAVGGDFNGSPLVEQWDGTQWSTVTVPVVAGAANNQFTSVRSLPGGIVLALGPSLAVLSNNG